MSDIPIRLHRPSEPYWIDLGPGLRVKVKPLDTATFFTARALAQRQAADLLAGLDETDPPQAVQAQALRRVLEIKALALMGIVGWEGIEEPAEGPAISAFIDAHPLAAIRFELAYLAGERAEEAEGNA